VCFLVLALYLQEICNDYASDLQEFTRTQNEGVRWNLPILQQVVSGAQNVDFGNFPESLKLALATWAEIGPIQLMNKFVLV
jgi:hypothetical protein